MPGLPDCQIKKEGYHKMPNKVIKTVARDAFEQLQAETNNSPILQGPFATRGYDVDVARLATTVAELDILRHAEAQARPGFEQDDDQKTILIPTIFAQVNGLPTDEKPYWSNLDRIRDSKGLEALYTQHLSSGQWQIDPNDATYLQDHMTPEALMSSADAWAYTSLDRKTQLNIADAITEIMDEWPFSVPKNESNIVRALTALLDLPKEVLDMAAEVDYPLEVPLLAFIHQQDLDTILFEDVVALMFFHQLGWDVIVYSPHGFASLENFLTAENFDIFQLDKIAPTSHAKGTAKKGFLGTLFG